jgi:hypothetical protein
MQIENLATTFASGTHRVSAEIDGLPLWFESADLELAPSPEAFASAMLIPALSKGESVVLQEPCDPQWLDNVEALQRVTREWWGYGIHRPQAPHRPTVESPRPTATALCFSGGADSFYSLLRCSTPIAYLVTVHGFDVKLDDTVRFARVEETTRKISAAIGAKSVVIRTNLRQHPRFAECAWDRSHGGALAGLGHLLHGHIGRLIVSSSVAYADDYPWGSHWKLDPLWSSSRVEIVYFGADHRRAEKVAAIAQEPLARQYLRVCWEHRDARRNCSQCEKCVRTRLVLASVGALDDFPVFDGTASLARDLDALTPKRVRGRVYTRLLADSGSLDWKVRRALRRFVARLNAPEHRSPPPNLLKRAVSRAFGTR